MLLLIGLGHKIFHCNFLVARHLLHGDVDAGLDRDGCAVLADCGHGSEADLLQHLLLVDDVIEPSETRAYIAFDKLVLEPSQDAELVEATR